MPGPLLSQVARSVPFDSPASENNALGNSVQDYIDRLSAPSNSQVATYLANGEVNTVTFYSSATQITANRLYLATIGYDGSLNPTSETWQLFDTADGTTVLKTFTFTNTFTGV